MYVQSNFYFMHWPNPWHQVVLVIHFQHKVLQLLPLKIFYLQLPYFFAQLILNCAQAYLVHYRSHRPRQDPQQLDLHDYLNLLSNLLGVVLLVLDR